MWSSGEGTITTTTTTTTNNSSRKVSSSSSKSSSSSSCPSPFSSSSVLPTPTRKTMEEVWKDIGLTSLHDRPTREDGPKRNSSFRGTNTILQDFLARPFKEPSINAVINPPDIDTGLLGPSLSPSPPTTALSLNSGPEFPYFDTLGFHNPPKNSNQPIQSQPYLCFPNAATASFISDTPKATFDAFGSSPAMSSLCKKRMSEAEDNSGDRRHKRMIKNRESASRSRARKQAYTSELELEVAHLMEENAKLRKQHQQLFSAASAEHPTKHTLCRTSTAPF